MNFTEHDPKHTARERTEDPLAEHVARNVRGIMAMRLSAERLLSSHQRTVERATGLLSRPASLYVIMLSVGAWIGATLLIAKLGVGVLDVWPFHALQGLIGLAALLVTNMVVITQNRQAQASERHMQLDLQVNLLTEQKVTKLIELIEELRRDLPNVRNRTDAAVDLLTQPTETLKVLAALEEQTLESVRESIAEERAAERIVPRDDTSG